MKNAIISIALVIVLSLINVCQLDANQMQRQSFEVKNVADQMADAAGLSLNLERYSRGYIVFDYDKGASLAGEVLRETLGYDASYNPANNEYFSDPGQVHIYYFDQTLEAKYYLNGSYVRSFPYTLGTKFKSYIASYAGEDTIDKPCVFVIFDAGKPRIRLSFAFGRGRICKTAIYEYR